MLATYIQTRVAHAYIVRVAAIIGFAAFTAFTARLTINLEPVPITLQVLAVLLAGLTLGAKDGALSQIAYVLAITAGLPIDAGSLGTAAWLRPSAGYLVGFITGAFVAGYLAEKGFGRWMLLRFLAGLAGVAVIYASGTVWLTYGFMGGDWAKGWQFGVQPFIVVDIAKAIIATILAESAFRFLEMRGRR